MPLDTGDIVERRRLRRSVSFWRVVALLLAVGVLGFAGWRVAGYPAGTAAPHVARVNLSGLILGGEERRKMFEGIARSGARAVIVLINSPGGGVAASEELYRQLRHLSETKPTVALVDSMGASGGYLAALGTDRIFARETAITGSIGVLVQFPNFSELLDKVGVQVESIKSAPLKAAPNGFEPTSPEARAALQSVVSDSFAWFKGLVGERRGLSGAALDRVSDGRIYTGRQAREVGLVDQVGGEDDVRAWLAANKGIPRDMPTRDWKPASGGFGLFALGRSLASGALDALGLLPFAKTLRASALSADLQSLDGVLALWQPSPKN
jgi:protease-4